MKPFNKKELAACETSGDAIDFFRNLELSDLMAYTIALENAKIFSDLTMRDEYLLNVANSELKTYRGL